MERGFGSDNHAGVHPQILKSLIEANSLHAPSYGTDDLSDQALAEFKKHFGHEVQTFFVFNGTAANVLALKPLTASFQGVFCSDTAHIHVDECGAPEFFLGSKIIPLKSQDGKIIFEELEKNYIRRGDQHHSQPQVLSITQPTELGTLYSIEELQRLITWAKSKNFYVHIDGARLSNAVAVLGTTFKQLTFDLGVDVVSFGGTKNGFMMGEAVIFRNKELARNFKFIRKQAGQLPSKTRFIACQFVEYLKDELWKDIAIHSHQMALYLYESCKDIPQIEIRSRPESNAVFAKIPQAWVKPLREKYFFYVWDESTFECRWMMSWDTQKSDIDGFVKLLKELAQ